MSVKHRQKYRTPEQMMVIRSVARIIQRVCAIHYKEATSIAFQACIFNVPKRETKGKTVARGYE